MLNIIWLAMLVVAVLVAGFSGRLPEMMDGAFSGAEKAVMKVALPLLGVWAIWLGIMRLAERSGLVLALAAALRPVMRRLFPDVPPEHPAIGAMVMNMAANMLGLGNAATPLGLRAMRLLESLNPRPGVATNAMVTFLALNTASIQLLPLMAITILATAGAKGATAIVITSFLSTVCAASAGVFVAKALQDRPAFRLDAVAPTTTDSVSPPSEDAPLKIEQPEVTAFTPARRAVLWSFFGAFLLLFVLLLFPQNIERLLQAVHAGWHAPLPPADHAGKPLWMRALMSASLLAVPFLLSFFPLYAALRGVRVYEQFVEGAHESWETAKRTVPYLVAMLMGIGMLQGAGVIDRLTSALARPLSFVGFPSELVPLVLVRPLSGSAAKSVFIELVNRPELAGGPDGFIARLAGTIYGSTETTFYVLAVYFGSVSIRHTRHAVAAGLTADIVAVIAATFFCTLLFR